MAAPSIGFHRGSSRRLAATVVLGILARCGDSFVLPRAAPDALRPLGARGWAARVDRGSHERARRRPGLTCVSAAESVAARGVNSLGEDSLASNVQVRVADADDVPRLSWVVTDVFVSEWKGPLQRPATWVQRQRMWVNVFLSMLTRIVCASFFLGLDIGEEARRSGVSVDVVEGAADARDAGSVGEAPPRAPVISRAATHRLFMTVVPGDGGTETVSGVIEVNCRKYPLPANASLLPDWGQEERPYISNLAVLPEYRGQGMANALMRAVEEEVRQWGYSDVVLDVDCNNLAALQLYHRRGYVAEFVDPATRKVRRAFMRKQLSPAAPPHPPDALSLTAHGRTQPADDKAGGSPRSGERQEEGAARKSPRAGDPAAYFAVPARGVRASFRPDSMYLPPPTALERLAGPLAPLVAGLGAVLGFIFF